LVGCLGSEPRLALSQTGGVRVVPRLFIEYPGFCLKTEEDHGKPHRLLVGQTFFFYALPRTAWSQSLPNGTLVKATGVSSDKPSEPRANDNA